jgi:DNA-binding FrmR family transcriptional regulator
MAHHVYLKRTEVLEIHPMTGGDEQMAHVHQNEDVKAQLISERDRLQKLIDRIDDETDCWALLAEVVASYKSLGGLCTELAVEHLSEHIAEVDDPQKRAQGVREMDDFLRTVVVGALPKSPPTA